MKRVLLSNKSGQGSVCVPAQSHDALFFARVEPLIKGASFEIEMQSGKFSQKRVYLGINLIELHVGQETLLMDKLLKPELQGHTLELIRQYKTGKAARASSYSFSLVLLD